MRRKDRMLSEDEAYKIIDDCVYATLSCLDDDIAVDRLNCVDI